MLLTVVMLLLLVALYAACGVLVRFGTAIFRDNPAGKGLPARPVILLCLP